jgi:hypothetical protein
MITRTTLPKSYEPYQRLTVCSNLITGGGHLVALGDTLPLLVGAGEAPLVWLQGPADITGKTYVPLVTASVASHPAVSVISDREALTVSVGGTPLIRVTQKDSDSAVIDLLDLRPIGLNIFGNGTSLNAGGAVFSNNTFSGVGTLLQIGQVIDTLPVHVFKDSFGPFLALLNAHHMKYTMQDARSGVQMAASGVIEILKSPAMWGTLATVVEAFLKARSSRKVIITKEDGAVVHVEELSPKELETALAQAKNVSAIETEKGET